MTVAAFAKSQPAARQDWMALLALADRETIAAALDALADKPAHAVLRGPEPGMVLVRGRAGGVGAPFNLGEMTVTRCTVRLADGVSGTAYVAGTDRRKAELCALADALLQTPAHGETLARTLIAPLRATRDAAQAVDRGKVAATRVDFFTMVRGD